MIHRNNNNGGGLILFIIGAVISYSLVLLPSTMGSNSNSSSSIGMVDTLM